MVEGRTEPANRISSPAMTPADPPGLEDLLQQAPDESPLDLQLAGARLRQALFALDPDPVRLGRYEVLERIGAGGMGTVYAALDPTLQRRLALKVLGRRAGVDGDERVRELVLREARAAARLSHPNVVTVFEAGEDGEQVYLAMELVEGETLRSWQRGAERSPEEVVEVYRQAGLGIAAAHGEGLVHGDFKPDNALMGRDGRVRVADFGLARPGEWDPGAAELPGSGSGAAPGGDGEPRPRSGKGRPRTAATTVAGGGAGGTPDYMAPELRDGAAASEASDQYAFCVSLYEALHGRLPPPGGIGGEPVPDWLGEVLQRGLDPAPAGRFGSMEELLAALQEGAAAAARPGPAPAPRRWRRWLVAGGVALAAVVLALVAARMLAPWWYYVRPLRDTRIEPAGYDGQAVRSLGLARDGRFLVHSDGTDLYRSEVDRPGEVLLTGSFAPRAIQPDVSPDGSAVAFSAEGALFVMALDGGSEPREVAERGYEPRFSPDGGKLAYTTEFYPEIKARLTFDGELRVLDLASGEVAAPLAGRPYSEAVHIDWSPDGRWIAVAGYAGVIAARSDGSAAFPVARIGWSPRWVDDGRALLFLWMYGRDQAVYRVDFDPETGESGMHPTPIVHLPQADGFPGWLEVLDGGQRLLLQRKRWPATMLRVPFDPEAGEITGDPAPIFEQPNTFTTPAVSPDGEWLAFVSYDSSADLYVARIDGSDLRALSSGENHTRNPAWTPDGSRVVFEGTRYDQWNSIWWQSPAGDVPQNLSGFASMPMMIPRYSPDGRRVALATMDQWPAVIDPGLPWMQQLMGQEVLDNYDWLTTDWSPDGQWIAAIKPSEGVSRLRADGLERELLLDRGDFAVWLPDGRRLLVDDGHQVLRLDAETGETAVVLDVAPAELATGASLALTPDGRTLIVATQQPGGSLEIVEFLDGG